MVVFALGCTTGKELVENGELGQSDLSPDSLIKIINQNSADELMQVKGKGRALVSQEGGNDRVTIEFYSDRETSLLHIRSAAGIEGGQVLVGNDSVLVYNKIDKYARISPISKSGGSDIGSLASVNLIDLLNYRLADEKITSVMEDNSFWVGILNSGGKVFVEKDTGYIRKLNWSRNSPYREIVYEGYDEIEGFELPRKITILSSDGKSRVVFLVQSLNVNSSLPELTINIPNNIPLRKI